MKRILFLLFTATATAVFSASVPLVVGFTYPENALPAKGTDLKLTCELTLTDGTVESVNVQKSANGKTSQLFVVTLTDEQMVARAVTAMYTLAYTHNGTPVRQRSGAKKICAVPFATHAKTISRAINGFVMKDPHPENAAPPAFSVYAPSASGSEADVPGRVTVTGAVGAFVPASDTQSVDTLTVNTMKLTHVGELTTPTLVAQTVTVHGRVNASEANAETWQADVFTTLSGD